jgi:ribose 5-phosphate isomerase B
MSEKKNDEIDKLEEIRSQVRQSLQREIGGPLPLPGGGSDPADLVDESVKSVITEADIGQVPAGGRLLLRDGVVITPLAVDLITSRRIRLVYRPARHGNRRMTIAIGADHGGFELKHLVLGVLRERGLQYRDFGTFSADPVDYPDIAHAVARAVADGVCDLGILLDGAGIGSCMAANKVPGIRAALCYDEASARNSREHNYANVLTLGAKLQTAEAILAIVRTWLETPCGEARHGKRVAKITAIEKQYLR